MRTLLVLSVAVSSCLGQCDTKGVDSCEQNFAACQWNGTQGCVVQQCAGLAEMPCNSDTECFWRQGCVPSSGRVLCMAGPGCVQKSYCSQDASGRCSLLPVESMCAAKTTSQDCIGGVCDWLNEKCTTYGCVFRLTEPECSADPGCVFNQGSCLRSPTATCAQVGTIECQQKETCGVDTSTTKNECIVCAGLDQTRCAATELCEWRGTACEKSFSCEIFSTEATCTAGKCFWEATQNECFGSMVCSELLVSDCTRSVGCEVLQNKCVYKNLPVDECVNLDTASCSFYLNCTYSPHVQACVASDRCTSPELCQSVDGCDQVGPHQCALLKNNEKDTCSGYALQGQCDPDDKCVWINNQCSFMLGCLTDNEAQCVAKPICNWNATEQQCSRSGPACDTLDFSSACNGAACTGIASFFVDTLVSRGAWVHDAYPPEVRPKTVISYPAPRGLACLGEDCSFCAPGNLMTLDVKLSCTTAGGVATITQLSGTDSQVCVPAYSSVMTPTTAPSAVPGNTTMSPTTAPGTAPNTTMSPTTAPGTAPNTTMSPTTAPQTTIVPTPNVTGAPPTTSPGVGVPPTLTPNTSAPQNAGPPSSDDDGTPTYVWILVAVGVVLLIAGIGGYFLYTKKAQGGKVSFQESLHGTEMGKNADYKPAGKM